MRGSLLFLGGRGDFIEKYIEAMAHWRGLGWGVSSFDWRGQGASQASGHAPDPKAGFDPLVQDLADFARDWMARSPAPHVIAAHSMGGHLLLRALSQTDLKPDAAVLIAPMIGINSAPIPAVLARPIARLAVALGLGERPVIGRSGANLAGSDARSNRLTSSPDRYADELWWQAREPAYDLGIPTWHWLTAAYRSIALLDEAALSRIDVPLLILAAERDRLVDTTAIRQIVRAIPNAALFVYPDAAHEILRESDAIRLDALARIDAFLDERAPR